MRQFTKAIYAVLSTAIAGATSALQDDDGFTLLEALGVLGAVVFVAGGVYGLRNEPAPLAPINQPHG